MFLDLEHGAVSGPAVPQIGQRDAEEMAETVSAGVVTVVVAALTVQSQVPFPWGGRGKAKKKKKKIAVKLEDVSTLPGLYGDNKKRLVKVCKTKKLRAENSEQRSLKRLSDGKE